MAAQYRAVALAILVVAGSAKAAPPYEGVAPTNHIGHRPDSETIRLGYSRFRVSDAQADRITSVEYHACMSRSVHNEQAVQCIREERGILEERLGASYRSALISVSNGGKRRAIERAQRRWLKDWPDRCSGEVRDAGPTPFDMVWHQCLINELIRRIAWLELLSSDR